MNNEHSDLDRAAAAAANLSPEALVEAANETRALNDPEVALAYISPDLKDTLRRQEVEYLRAKTVAAYSMNQRRLAELYTELADLFEQGEPMPGVDYPVA